MYVANEKIYTTINPWIYYNIYENQGVHTIFKRDVIEPVKNIENIFNVSTYDPIDIGNRLRKKFEMSIHEISKIFMINTIDETSTLIERIRNNKTIYVKKLVDSNNKVKFKSVYDLLEEIEIILKRTNPDLTDIKTAVQSYKLAPHAGIISILNNLKLYQKTILHPMSHAHNAQGMATFTSDEIKETLVLLGQLEKWIKDCKSNANVNDF